MSEQSFINAARNKYRFVGAGNGVLSVENLWDAKESLLEAIHTYLKGELKQYVSDETDELFRKTRKTDAQKEIEDKLAIIAYIVRTRRDEQEAKEKAASIKEYNAMIATIIEEKESEELKKLSVEELRKRMK